MKKLVAVILLSMLFLFGLTYCYYYINYERTSKWPAHGDPNIVGYVPDEKTAIRVAEALWLPLFGDGIYESRPFVATLKDSVWFVQGTLDDGARGGVPHAEFLKNNCRVIRVYHTK